MALRSRRSSATNSTEVTPAPKLTSSAATIARSARAPPPASVLSRPFHSSVPQTLAAGASPPRFPAGRPPGGGADSFLAIFRLQLSGQKSIILN